jgi:hypothetical protein
LLRNDAIAMPRHHVGDTNAAVNTRGGLFLRVVGGILERRLAK